MAQIVDHRDLLTAYRPGDLPASERIVRVYQNELLRAAFLLAGTPDGAVLLTRDTFLSFFRLLVRGDAPDDPRLGLFQQLGRRFLADPATNDSDNGDHPERDLVGTVSFEQGQQRYRVEDERTRVLSALEILDRPTRLGLVLRDFNGLDEEPVCQILDETPFALRDRLLPARERVQDTAGARPGTHTRELLVNAATAAPRPNIWPEVIEPLEEIYAEEDERRQRYTYAAAALVGLLLIVAGLWLFDVFPFGSGDGDQAALAPTAGPSPTPTATPEPTLTPTPVPGLSSYAIPQGDVPGHLIMGIGGIQGIQRVSEAGFFDLESGTYSPHEDLNQFGTPSPDGRFLVGIINPDHSPDVTTTTLVAVDSNTGEQLWRAELPDGQFTFVVTLDRIYVTTSIAMDDAETPSVLEFDLETGQMLATHPDIVSSILNDITSTIRVVLRTSPDNEHLFVALEEFGTGPTTMLSRTLASYTLPDLTFESASTQTDSTSVRQFPNDFSFVDARVTPDGAYLYNINHDTVQFRSAKLNEDIDRSLPFTTQLPGSEESDLRWITSNDGRYLYILALERNEVAIVDLLARRIVRSFPLDTAADVTPVQRIRPAALGDSFGAGLALSSDGRFLYVAGGIASDATSGSIERSIIWTIDLTTWTVTRSQEIPGLLLSISYLDDRLYVSTEPPSDPQEPSSNSMVIDPETGEVVNEIGSEGLPEWVDQVFVYSLSKIYHVIYGRAPAVDHTAFSDIEAESTLPRIAVLTSEKIVPAGVPVDIGVRALNPVDGQLQVERSTDVRFSPDSTVIVKLRRADGAADEITLIANRVEPGRYLASSTILATGSWNAEVTITESDGNSWSRTFEDLFEVVPSWEASDGKRYVLRVQTDPTEPPRNEPVTITARFVDADTGSPMPGNVQILDDFPDRLSVTLNSAGNNASTAILTRSGEDNVWEGGISFPAVDTWEAEITIEFDDGERVEVQGGFVNVVR